MKQLTLKSVRHKMHRTIERSSGNRPLVSNSAVLIIIGALIITTFVTLNAKSQTTVPTKVDLTSATSTQVNTAVAWADSLKGRNEYNQLCLPFVQAAYAQAGITIDNSPDPVHYWAANPNHWLEHPSAHVYNNPPRGALMFWGVTQWSTTGHIAISEGANEVISSAAYPYFDKINHDPRVLEFSLSSSSTMYRNPATYNYLGYMMPGETTAPVSTPASAIQAPKTNTPTPVPPTPVSTKPSVPNDQPTPSPVKAVLSSGAPATPPAQTPLPTSPPSPVPVPPVPTYSETVGSGANTWTNYTNAGGNQGAEISSNSTVQIACKITGFKVADGDTWWYRIASGPWNGNYYVSADAFYNNGHTSGTLKGTPFVDGSVPNC